MCISFLFSDLKDVSVKGDKKIYKQRKLNNSHKVKKDNALNELMSISKAKSMEWREMPWSTATEELSKERRCPDKEGVKSMLKRKYINAGLLIF